MIDITFLLATLTKLPAGAYWSLIIAAVPFTIIVIYHFGQKRIYRYLQPIPFQRFLNEFREVYAAKSKIEGTALFFSRDFQQVPPYVGLTVFENNIIYEDNVLVSIRTLDRPFGISWEFRKSPARGIRLFEVRSGYLEMLDVVAIFREAGLEEKTIFYGLDEIVSTNFIWKIFALIKRLSPSFVQFYKLPANRIHGVVTRVEARPRPARRRYRAPPPVKEAGWVRPPRSPSPGRTGIGTGLAPSTISPTGRTPRTLRPPFERAAITRAMPEPSTARIRNPCARAQADAGAGAGADGMAERTSRRPSRRERSCAPTCAPRSKPEQVLPEPLDMHRLRREPAIRSIKGLLFDRQLGRAGLQQAHSFGHAAAGAASRARARARLQAGCPGATRPARGRPRLTIPRRMKRR